MVVLVVRLKRKEDNKEVRERINERVWLKKSTSSRVNYPYRNQEEQEDILMLITSVSIFLVNVVTESILTRQWKILRSSKHVV